MLRVFGNPGGTATGAQIEMADLARRAGAWEHFRVTLEDVIDAGSGQVLVLARAKVRTRGTGVEMTQNTAILNRVVRGRIFSMRFYLDQQQARRDASLD